MTLEVNIRHDLKRLENALGLYPRELLLAATRAQNRTITTLRSIAVNELHPDFAGLKKGAIRRQIKLTKATSKAPQASLEFSARRFRLFGNYNVRQTKTGVRMSRFPWSLETADGMAVDPGELAHAFIQRSRNTAHPNVWVRVGAQRYPITSIVVSGLSTAFRARNFGTNLVGIGRNRFAIELRREARFRLSMRDRLRASA